MSKSNNILAITLYSLLFKTMTKFHPHFSISLTRFWDSPHSSAAPITPLDMSVIHDERHLKLYMCFANAVYS